MQHLGLRAKLNNKVRTTAKLLGLAVTGLIAQAVPSYAQSNPVIFWNDQLISVIQQTSALMVAGPPEVAREMAIVDDAMYDAANAVSGTSYAPVAYSGAGDPTASMNAAVLSAGYTAMRGIFANNVWSGSGGSAAIQSAMLSKIDNAYSSALSSLSISLSDSGIALGQSAGNANLAKAGYTIGDNSAGATDGSYSAIINGLNTYTPTGSGSVPGVYVPPASRPAMYPTWGSVTPVGLTSAEVHAAEATVSGPPSVTSQAYATALLETECSGSGNALSGGLATACAAAGYAPETAAQSAAALFWNDPGTTLQPPGHWLQITDTVATSQGLDTLQTARVSALVSQAEFDAGIAAWDVKYQDNLWRPVTAIHDCSGWNPNFTTCDPTWTSLIATPPHPDYLAGHPAFSGAAATVLENFLGTDDIAFSSTSDEYCNGGTTWRSGSTGLIVACTTNSGQFSFDDGYNSGRTIYAGPTGCADAGGTTGVDGAGHNTCTLGGQTYAFNPSITNGTGCNDIVNGGSNDSLLICPITENFNSFSAASNGPYGSEYSRVAGGIHTPFAVQDALTVGDAIGMQISSDNNIPEPMAMALLSSGIITLAGVRRMKRRMPLPA
jgi:hypothetical protein